MRSAPLDDDSFSALMAAIEATPETFVVKLNDILDKRGISPWDLLPNEASYWDRLIPNPKISATLAEYVATELGARGRAWLTRDLQSGLRRIAPPLASFRMSFSIHT